MNFKRHPPKLENKISTSQKRYQQGGTIKVLPFCELEAATGYFSDENIVGKGSFGVVYKGQLPDGSSVAIKRLPKETHSVECELQFLTQVEVLSKASHPNLLKLKGFCSRPDERLLVYPFIAIGSLASRLKSHPPLSWPARIRIAQGVASALAYLHEDCHHKIIHHLLKSTNVLLDEDFNVIVGDYGLVELMDYKDCQQHINIAMDDQLENGTRRCSEATDVCAYGILLLELITGQKADDIAQREKKKLSEWVNGFLENKELQNLVDSDMRGKYVYHEVEDLICVALQCIQGSPRMSEVVKMLENPDYWKMMKPKLVSSLTQQGSFTLSELQAATDNFDSKNILGKGLYGCTVYKGQLTDGSLVAVKRLDKNVENQELLFQSEILVMRNISPHQNLLRVSGFCISGNENFLVYPQMTKGNLASKLPCDHESKIILDWSTRNQIALGVAKGLAHLHNSSRFQIIHGNLKAANILFDKDYEPVIGGFSCCQLEESENEDVIDFQNTFGDPRYLAPERLLMKKCTSMSDVFAYGILLYELVTGEAGFRIVELHSEEGVSAIGNEWSVNQIRRYRKADRWLIDVDLSSSGYVEEEWKELLKVASMCTQTCPGERPTMMEVVRMLEAGVSRDCDWEKLLGESSPPRTTHDHNSLVANIKAITTTNTTDDHNSLVANMKVITIATTNTTTTTLPIIAYRWYGCLQRWEPVHLSKQNLLLSHRNKVLN